MLWRVADLTGWSFTLARAERRAPPAQGQFPPQSGVRVADQFGFNAQLRMSPELAIALVKPDCENCWVLPSAMTMFPAFT